MRELAQPIFSADLSSYLLFHRNEEKGIFSLLVWLAGLEKYERLFMITSFFLLESFFTISWQQVLSTTKTTTTLFSIAISIHGVRPTLGP